MSSDQSIMALLDAARQGDRDARNKIAEFLRPHLRTYAAKEFPTLIQPRADPSDVVQDVLLRIDDSLNEFRGTSVGELIRWGQWKVKGKISDLREKHVKAKYQSVKCEVASEAADHLLSGIASKDPSARSILIAREALHAAIAAMPPKVKQVMQQIYVEQKPVADIASGLGVSEMQIHKLELQGLKTLRDAQDLSSRKNS